LAGHTRAIPKVTSVYFRQLIYEWGRVRACEVESHNWSPSVLFLSLQGELCCILRLIIPPAAKFPLLSFFFTLKT
jgi:hypothetical protein